jgi:hypothetical protein
MPKTTVQHETWCQEHVGEAGWNMCNTDTIKFGPIRASTFDGHEEASGALWLTQDEHEDNGVMVAGSYGVENFRIDEDAARAVLAAASEDPAALVGALSAALAQLAVESAA